MKRLVKKAEGQITYTFVSPIIVNIGDEQFWNASTELLTNAQEYEDVIRDAVSDSMHELGSKGLARYFREIKDEVIESIIVDVVNCKAKTTVIANRELTDEEIDVVKEFIIGQFSDGWGEGFEQQMLLKWTETMEEEIEDEETGESYTEDVDYEATMSASFWNDKNWNIELIEVY